MTNSTRTGADAISAASLVKLVLLQSSGDRKTCVK